MKVQAVTETNSDVFIYYSYHCSSDATVLELDYLFLTFMLFPCMVWFMTVVHYCYGTVEGVGGGGECVSLVPEAVVSVYGSHLPS